MFKVVKYDASYLKEVIDLFLLIWGGDKQNVIKKTKWVFDKKRSKAYLILNERNQLIAVRGGIYWPTIFNGKKIKSIQFGSTCVHPEYRRRGLFSKMNSEYLKNSKDVGDHLIFNVSVDSARKGYEKLGWIYTKGFQRLTTFHLLNYFNKCHTGEPNMKFVETIPESVLKYRHQLFKNFNYTFYDIDFLKWRLSNNAEGYKICYYSKTYIIYKSKIINGKKNLLIGDVFSEGLNFNDFKELLKNIINYEKPVISYTYIHNNSPYYKFYLRCFFIPNFFNLNLNLGFRNINLSSEDYYKNWCCSYLDLDTF